MRKKELEDKVYVLEKIIKSYEEDKQKYINKARAEQFFLTDLKENWCDNNVLAYYTKEYPDPSIIFNIDYKAFLDYCKKNDVVFSLFFVSNGNETPVAIKDLDYDYVTETAGFNIWKKNMKEA